MPQRHCCSRISWVSPLLSCQLVDSQWVHNQTTASKSSFQVESIDRLMQVDALRPVRTSVLVRCQCYPSWLCLFTRNFQFPLTVIRKRVIHIVPARLTIKRSVSSQKVEKTNKF